MTAIQPDLFGDFDRAQEAAAQQARPARCPACGTEEPNGWLLGTNHGIGVDGTIGGFPLAEHPIFGGHCLAQHLVSNHIRFYATRDEPEGLARAMERGRALGLDPEAIYAEAVRKPAR